MKIVIFRKITNIIYLVFCLNLKYRPNNNFLQFMYLDEEFSLQKVYRMGLSETFPHGCNSFDAFCNLEHINKRNFRKKIKISNVKKFY